MGVEITENPNDALRARSGSVNINGRLTSFLYQLIRDYLPAGDVEKIVRDSETNPDVNYTNGWIAKYANDLAERLKDK